MKNLRKGKGNKEMGKGKEIVKVEALKSFLILQDWSQRNSAEIKREDIET